MLEQGEQGVHESGGDAGVPACQRIDFQSQSQAHHCIRQRIAHARRVRQQQISLQQFELFGGYAGLGEQTETRVDAVGRFPGGDDLVHQGARRRDSSAIVRRQTHHRRLLVDAP